MVPFHYRRIDRPLVEELIEGILNGESLVLLGPRHSGKREVMRRLCALQDEAGVEPVVRLQLLTEPVIDSEAGIRRLIREAVALASQSLPQDADDSEDILAPLDQLSSRTGRPVTLYAANVDGMAYHLARSFLEGVRVRVEAGRLVVVLSGEDDFRDLVHGPKSEFNCANQFVFSGYARDEFHSLLVLYAEKLRLELEPTTDAIDRLWELTGGSLHVSRMILRAILDARARLDSGWREPAGREEMWNATRLFDALGLSGADVYRHAARLVEREPDCWDDLEGLLRGTPVMLAPGEAAPSRLELAGVAVRVVSAGSARLQFASPLIESFARRYYDGRRFGDLYARVGMWSRAFQLYSRLPHESMLRPSGVDDRGNVEVTVNALCASLFAEAIKGVGPVKELFTQGCRYVLGLSDVSFWRRGTRKGDENWHCETPSGHGFDQRLMQTIAERLNASVESSFGLLSLGSPLDSHAIAALLPGNDEIVAVVASDFGKRQSLSRSRERLGKLLLHHFVLAYTHANSVDLTLVRLAIRERHVSIMNSIFSAMGESVLDVNHVLQMAASGLRRLGYRRIIISLVDSEKQRIEAFFDSSDDSRVNLASMIDLPLREHEADLQPHVIHTREPVRVPLAANEPLANPQMVREGGVGAFALVPILDPAGAAVGTIHVEREDGAVPSEREVTDLMFFGRQLAIAMKQSERVNMLESALDKIPEPIVIVGRAERRHYANQPATQLLGVPAGWERPDPGRLQFGEETENLAGVVEQLHESLSTGRRLVTHVRGVGRQDDYRAAVLTDIIRDWRQQTIGGLLHIQDFNYLHKVFQAAQLVAGAKDTESAMQSMLDAAKLLGHQWGRLYLTDDADNPQSLISTLSFGYTDPELERRFNEGEVILASKSEPGSIDWLSFEERKPLVFCWKDELEPGEIYVTRFGLKAINTPHVLQPEEIRKRPGDFWIDFPLITQEKVLGKLCLQCDANLRPEDFELLKILSETAAGLFESFLSRARVFGEREQMITISVAEKIMAILAHNLVTRLGALPPTLARYRLLEEKFRELKACNDDFEHVMEDALVTVRRAKDLFAPVIPQRAQLDLVKLIERTLASVLPESAWRVEADDRPIELDLDAHLFETALLELIQNSRDAAPPVKKMRITVSLSILPTDVDGERRVRIVLRDNGPGIPAEFKKRIWEDFFSRRPGGGASTGLGLSYVRRVVQAHGGTIITGPGEDGAEFILTLPMNSKAD